MELQGLQDLAARIQLTAGNGECGTESGPGNRRGSHGLGGHPVDLGKQYTGSDRVTVASRKMGGRTSQHTVSALDREGTLFAADVG